MKEILILGAASSASSASSGTGAGSMESLKKIFTNPVLYIVLGAIVLLIIAFYLYKRFVKAMPNATTIIVRKGKIHKVLNEQNPKYFMVPFKDSIGAIITNEEKQFASDKLFINNGPDALYKIDYVLKYRVRNPAEFYPHLNGLEDALATKINDALRLYADEGHADVVVKDYREKGNEIIAVLNKALADYQIEVTEFKINFIQPMGA